MRAITTHKVNGCNEALIINVLDEPGNGGANHKYDIFTPDFKVACPIYFQDGPIPEVGTNGVTHEALLAVIIDRLEGFQRGKFAHSYNADALASLRSAMASFDFTKR